MSISVAEAAAIVAAMNNAGGGGGGGDSDFSTCKVTFTNIAEDNVYIAFTIPFIDQDGYLRTTLLHEGNDPITIDVVLYRREGLHTGEYNIENIFNWAITETSGDIFYDSGADEYTIFGDCSITVNMED